MSSFALDDFGSGHTALRYFNDFKFDVLKIDGQFIKSINSDPDIQALVRAMIDIAKHFDMLTVAEFVETRAEVETLIAVGADCLQGFYFSAPSVQHGSPKTVRCRMRHNGISLAASCRTQINDINIVFVERWSTFRSTKLPNT